MLTISHDDDDDDVSVAVVLQKITGARSGALVSSPPRPPASTVLRTLLPTTLYRHRASREIISPRLALRRRFRHDLGVRDDAVRDNITGRAAAAAVGREEEEGHVYDLLQRARFSHVPFACSCHPVVTSSAARTCRARRAINITADAAYWTRPGIGEKISRVLLPNGRPDGRNGALFKNYHRSLAGTPVHFFKYQSL